MSESREITMRSVQFDDDAPTVRMSAHDRFWRGLDVVSHVLLVLGMALALTVSCAVLAA